MHEKLSELFTVRITPTMRESIEQEAARLQVRPIDVARMALARGLEVQRAGQEAAGVERVTT